LIAFVSDRDSTPGTINDEIYVAHHDGSDPRRLTNNPATDQFPAVSPNGKEIAFTSDRTGTSQIYVMDASDDNGDGNGDNLRAVTSSLGSKSGVAWSPDGKTLAFARDSGFPGPQNLDIYVIPADGSEPARNLTPGSAKSETQPRFSPDGTKIAFVTTRDGNLKSYTMNVDGSGPQQITSSTANDSHPDFSPDGSRLTFARDTGFPGAINLDIYVMDAAPESATNIPINLTANLTATNERFPVWSPDGTKIAFWSGIGGGFGKDAEIYVMNADGSDQMNITNNTAGDITPDWGPAPVNKPKNHAL
jgi:Tol biopolymer transport system component